MNFPVLSALLAPAAAALATTAPFELIVGSMLMVAAWPRTDTLTACLYHSSARP